MAYTAPTAVDMLAAYPAFNCVDADLITRALARAERMVDESWTEGDFAEGRMLYAAHLLTMQGLGDTAEAENLAQGGMIKRRRAADHEVEFVVANISTAQADAMAAGGLASTSYGRQFALLAKVNVGGPMVTGRNLTPPRNHMANDFQGLPFLYPFR